MTLLEEICKKIINQRLIDWFGIRHAKVLNTIKKHEKLLASEIMLITCIEKQHALQALQELRKAKLIGFNGEQYILDNEIETMQKLMQMSEKQGIKALSKSK